MDRETGLFICGIILGAAFAAVIAIVAYRNDAAANGVGQYNQKTGAFEWVKITGKE